MTLFVTVQVYICVVKVYQVILVKINILNHKYGQIPKGIQQLLPTERLRSSRLS